jgi:teichuronic acid biosynthesis protein TuaE
VLREAPRGAVSVVGDIPAAPSASLPRSGALLSAVAILGAGVVGAVSGGFSPLLAAGGVVALLLGALMARIPTLVFGGCLLALTYSPEFLGPATGVFAHPQLQKGLLYFAIVGMILHRGVRPRFLIVIVAYVSLALLSAVNGQLAPGLTLGQVFASFVTLTVGWTALSARWRWDADVRYLRVLACLPITSVLLGVALQAAGQHGVWEIHTGADTSTRLAGAAIPDILALTSFIACVTASICYRLTRWRPAPVLVVVNATILTLTISRGASIALAIAMLYPALRFVFSRGPAVHTPQWLRIGALAVGIILALVIAVPALLSRDSNGFYTPGSGTVYDITSGRSLAWAEFFAIGQQSPLFGHGLGAGPITKVQEQGFLAQHNEYLRLFLEGGYIGGGLVLLAIVIVVATCIARSPPAIRLDLVSLVAGFAVLSYTDNTLTSVILAIPFCLLLGICASWSSAWPRPVVPPRPNGQGAPIPSGS